MQQHTKMLVKLTLWQIDPFQHIFFPSTPSIRPPFITNSHSTQFSKQSIYFHSNRLKKRSISTFIPNTNSTDCPHLFHSIYYMKKLFPAVTNSNPPIVMNCYLLMKRIRESLYCCYIRLLKISHWKFLYSI